MALSNKWNMNDNVYSLNRNKFNASLSIKKENTLQPIQCIKKSNKLCYKKH